MKKYLLFAFLAIAIASFGGTTVLAHAQTVAAGSQATLQQQLELMKAKLQLLQLQQAQQDQMGVAATPAPVQPAPVQPTIAISASDAAALNSALSALATTLVSLQSAIQSNPQFVPQNGPVIAQALSRIGGSLAAVLVSMQTPAQAAPIASAGTAPANTGSAAPLVLTNPTPAQIAAPSQPLNQESLLPSVNSLTQPVNTQNNEPAVAASALGDKNRLPAIIVGIILLAMIAILVWGRGGEELETVPARIDYTKSAPVAPVPPSISFISNQQMGPGPAAPASSSSSPSPLASAMGTQKNKGSF